MPIRENAERSKLAMQRRRREGHAQISNCFGCGERCGKGAVVFFREAICVRCMTRGAEYLRELAKKFVHEKDL